jgi:hypothetical protein
MRYVLALLLAASAWGYQEVVIADGCHAAVRSAAQILGLPVKAVAHPGAPAPGQIVLEVEPSPEVRHDGYRIVFSNGGARVLGNRPRSLLYAAGDYPLWKNRTSGTYTREPAFALRIGQYDANRTVAQYVALLGVNALIDKPNSAVVTLKSTLPEVYNQLSAEERERMDRGRAARVEQNRAFAKECADADVPLYAFLYGNDFELWSRSLLAAMLKAYPAAKGTPAPHSWEKARLCPSDRATWKFVRAYIKDFMEQSAADGMYATFWDRYGINCHDERCRRDGLDRFPNQLYECVRQYREALEPMGKKLVVRTWSSGAPHWLRDEYVHAPGYGAFGGEGIELWGRVFRELPADIMIQTKVYDSDCQPDARFNPLLGQAKPHTEIAEYQIAGQTVGRFYFPASSVDYNTWTMRKAHDLEGDAGGVNVFPGGTHQSNYSLFDDIANSINLYAWREVSWNLQADLDRVWMDWAVPVYGERAAPHIVKALRLSEEAVNRTFSPLGFGSSTNSDFAGNIARKETLLMYTNRQDLPEYAKFLEPTKENIARVAEEKAAALRKIDEMERELEAARPFLRKEQAEELATRFDWLQEFAICSRYIDESLWRYRYLRHLAEMLTTDPAQLRPIAEAYEGVKEHQKRLFRYDAAQKFSCYSTTLGQLRVKPELGNPVPLMKELYEKSRETVESIAGPLE